MYINGQHEHEGIAKGSGSQKILNDRLKLLLLSVTISVKILVQAAHLMIFINIFVML